MKYLFIFLSVFCFLSAEGSTKFDALLSSHQSSSSQELNKRKTKIEGALKLDLPFNEAFELHRELFVIRFIQYRKFGGSIEELNRVLKESYNQYANNRKDYLYTLDEPFSSLVFSYIQLFELASDLTVQAVAQFRKNHNPYLVSEPYRPYYLDIQELEEKLKICGYENSSDQGPVLAMAYSLMQAKMIDLIVYMVIYENLEPLIYGYGNLSQRLRDFYWDTMIPAHLQCMKLMERTELFESMSSSPEFVKFIFDVLVDWRGIYRPRSEKDDLVDCYFPYAAICGTLEPLKSRFNQREKALLDWDRSYEWLSLYVKGALLVKDSHPERSKMLFAEAKKLANESFSCYFFNPNRSSWRKTEEKAHQLVHDAEEILTGQ